MHILYLELTLSFYDVFSLKERRAIVRSVRDRLRNKYNISVAERAGENHFRKTGLGIVSVGSDKPLLMRLRERVLTFLDTYPQFDIIIEEEQIL